MHEGIGKGGNRSRGGVVQCAVFFFRVDGGWEVIRKEAAVVKNAWRGRRG